MKKSGAFKAARANRNILGEVVSLLMATAMAIRGLIAFPEVRLEIAGLLAIFVIILLAEPLFRRLSGWGLSLYLLGQIGVMVGLFLLTPSGDFWAIMLLPACVYVMRHFRQAVAWAWIGVFVVAMIIMVVFGEGPVNAIEFIITYIAAYFLIGSYALLLRQADDAREESQRLLQQLQQSNTQLQDYVVQVEELTAIKERNRLARDLHDAVTQSIFSMTLITRSALILQERDPSQVKDKLVQLQELAQGALQEMRDLIYQLRTFSVEEDGLYPVLHKYIDGVASRDDLHITLDSEPETLPLEPVQQQELYRIIQEAINNVVKHARADRVVIGFAVSESAVMVTIRDNGIGFNPGQLNNDSTHIGLDSMRERAEELGGTMKVNAQPGTGTEIEVVVPISVQRMLNE